MITKENILPLLPKSLVNAIDRYEWYVDDQSGDEPEDQDMFTLSVESFSPMIVAALGQCGTVHMDGNAHTLEGCIEQRPVQGEPMGDGYSQETELFIVWA